MAYKYARKLDKWSLKLKLNQAFLLSTSKCSQNNLEGRNRQRDIFENIFEYAKLILTDSKKKITSVIIEGSCQPSPSPSGKQF